MTKKKIVDIKDLRAENFRRSEDEVSKAFESFSRTIPTELKTIIQNQHTLEETLALCSNVREWRALEPWTDSFFKDFFAHTEYEGNLDKLTILLDHFRQFFGYHKPEYKLTPPLEFIEERYVVTVKLNEEVQSIYLYNPSSHRKANLGIKILYELVSATTIQS